MIETKRREDESERVAIRGAEVRSAPGRGGGGGGGLAYAPALEISPDQRELLHY